MAESDLTELESWVARQLAPPAEVADRVWSRVLKAAPFPSRRGWQRPIGMWHLGAAAACLIAICGAVAFAAVRIASPGASFQVSLTPAQSGLSSSGSGAAAQGGHAAAGSSAAAPSTGIAGGAPASGGGISSALTPAYLPACALAPIVQLRSPGVTATGYANIESSKQEWNLSIGVQTGGESTAISAQNLANTIARIDQALAGVGVPPGAITETQSSVYAGNGQVTPYGPTYAYAYLSITVATQKIATQAVAAAISAGAISANSSGPVPSGSPTPTEVAAAVAQASTQAEAMAASEAKAAKINLGQVESISAQPPSVCYVAPAVERVVAVTVVYAIR